MFDNNKEFKVNDYLTLRLEPMPQKQEGQETVIYVAGEWFRQCGFLLLNIPVNKISSFDEIDSIDEAAAKLDRSQERNKFFKQKVSPEVEFWGHCSNLQVWAEHYYDTRLLHSNLSFPLLKRLTEAGDPIANQVFREEIAKRLERGYQPVIEFLTIENYVEYLTHEEILLAMLELKEAEAILRIEKIIGRPFEILRELPETREGATLIIKNRHVETLSLFDCNLKVIPNELKSLVKIERLDIGGNQMTTLPEWIYELKNLEHFNASGNKINKLPNWIECLKNLKLLDLSFNNITEIPEIIGTLKNLKFLYISNCPINIIPESLLNLPSLEVLNVHDDFLINTSKKMLMRFRKKKDKQKKSN